VAIDHNLHHFLSKWLTPKKITRLAQLTRRTMTMK